MPNFPNQALGDCLTPYKDLWIWHTNPKDSL